MNILIISRGIPTSQDPQWGSFEFDQAKALAKLGHSVCIASVDSRFRLFWRKLGLTIEEREGVRCYNYFLCPGIITGILGSKFKNNVKSWQWQQIIQEINKRERKIDVIYSHYLSNSYYAVHFLKNIHAPIVSIEHWSKLNIEPLPSDIHKMAIETYPQVQQVITVAKSLQDRLENLFGIKAKVIYNLVGDEFHYSPTKSNNTVHFITTGSLVYRKGFDLFAKAFAKLNLPKEQWELNIIGEGEEHQHLRQQIIDAGLQDNIHLVGSKNKIEIAKLLNESDVFVLPSRNENFSVAVLEALACGLPVVASICGGIRECIDEKNGLLFEVDDVEGLAKCLKHMYGHYQEYDRQAIADNCQSRFSSEVIAKQLTEIFEEVVSKHANKQKADKTH